MQPVRQRHIAVRQIDGIAYGCYVTNDSDETDPFTETSAFGATMNSPFFTVTGAPNVIQPAFVWAASIAGVAAASLAIDPARQLQTLPLPGIIGPAQGKGFIFTEQNLLLHDGISTFDVGTDGTVSIQRQITTYQKNAGGVLDASYLDVTTIANLSYLRYTTRAFIVSNFPRYKLADDGTPIASGQAIVTPTVIAAGLVSLASDWVDDGLIQDLASFKTSLVVQRNADDPNRVDVLSNPNLVGNLIIFAEQIQFLLGTATTTATS